MTKSRPCAVFFDNFKSGTKGSRTDIPYVGICRRAEHAAVSPERGNGSIIPVMDKDFEETLREAREKKSDERLTNGEENGIMKIGSDDVTISSIDSPIEQKHTGKGNPNAILIFDIELNNRQQELLDALPNFDSRITVPKKSVNMADLSALTAKTGDEFAMFTNKDKRLVIRGNEYKVNIDIEQAKNLAAQGYKWSGHTHPGSGQLCLTPSDGDRQILKIFKQRTSVIYNSQGQFSTFEEE